MVKIGIVVGSLRRGRKADAVARWVLDIARDNGGAEYEIVDIRDLSLPFLDEEVPPSVGQYSHDHAKRWAERVSSATAAWVVPALSSTCV